MAVRHEVRTSEGLVTKMLTVVKAIRCHCVECVGSIYETKACGVMTGKDLVPIVAQPPTAKLIMTAESSIA